MGSQTGALPAAPPGTLSGAPPGAPPGALPGALPGAPPGKPPGRPPRRLSATAAWRRSARFRRLLRRSPLISPLLWRRRLIVWGGAVAVALVAIAFAALADRATEWFGLSFAAAPWSVLLLGPAGLAVSVLLTRHAFPGAQGSGIPQTIAALHMHDQDAVAVVLSLRVACGKVVLTLLGLLCGASIGREGPTVQIGAAIMYALGRWLRMANWQARRALILAGGAAGIAAAFNTPLAGIVFAIEELSHSFEARASGTVLTAVILAGITTLALAGNYTYFGVTNATLRFGAGWVTVLVCGLAGGLAGGAFSRALITAARGLPGLAGRFVAARPVVFAGLCGVVVALVGIASGGATFGTGYAQARALVNGSASLPGVFFCEKLVATIASYCSGVPGGIFAPSLSIGAGLGRTIAQYLPYAQTNAVVLLGMCAYFSGVVQAPITSAIIVMEMTDNQSMTIPLLAVAVLGFVVSRLVCRRPLYGTLARRFIVGSPAASVPRP